MLVRPYTVSDRDPVASLDVSTQVASVAAVRLDDSGFTWTELPLEKVRTKDHAIGAYLDERPNGWDEAFVAIADRRVVGFSASRLSGWNRRLILCHMYVDAATRGTGVGTALLRAVLHGEQAAPAQHVWLETQPDNVAAIRAYERMGFRLVGLDQTLYGDSPDADTAIFMSRRIVP